MDVSATDEAGISSVFVSLDGVIVTGRTLPVCGCDGVTYTNACQAAAAGVNVAHAGICQ